MHRFLVRTLPLALVTLAAVAIFGLLVSPFEFGLTLAGKDVTINFDATLPFGSRAQAKTSKSMTVPLNAQGGSKLDGVATLSESTDPGAHSLTVKILFPNNVFIPENQYPSAIYRGTCAKLDPKPAYSLKPMMTGSSTTTLKGVTIRRLLAKQHAIAIAAPHEMFSSPTPSAVPRRYLACGEIRRSSAASPLSPAPMRPSSPKPAASY